MSVRPAFTSLLVIVALVLVLVVPHTAAGSCDGLAEQACISTCGCSPCYYSGNSTFAICASTPESCPISSNPRIPLQCDPLVIVAVVFDGLCLIAWHLPGVAYGVYRLIRPLHSSGQRRWFWTQVGYVLVICTMFALPLSLSEHLRYVRTDRQDGLASLYQATLFMFALTMVLNDFVHIVEHEDDHAKGHPSRLLNIAFIVVHTVFALLTAFLLAITLLTLRWNATSEDVQATLDVLDGCISVLVGLVTLADYAYGSSNNLRRLRFTPLRVRLIVAGVPAVPTLAVLVLLPLFFALDSGAQLLLHLAITLFAIGTTRTLRIMTRAAKFAALAQAQFDAEHGIVHADHEHEREHDAPHAQPTEKSALLPGDGAAARLPAFLSSMVAPMARMEPAHSATGPPQHADAAGGSINRAAATPTGPGTTPPPPPPSVPRERPTLRFLSSTVAPMTRPAAARSAHAALAGSSASPSALPAMLRTRPKERAAVLPAAGSAPDMAQSPGDVMAGAVPAPGTPSGASAE